ncbi:MAG: hypothetical protein IKL57_00450 [Oscillospiraceae bacterium]|nr:hypothetical protein [Oscillospiraceae bacterium]
MPEKAVVLLNRGFFSYDDVQLKPPQKRDPRKIQKIFGEEERQQSGFGVLSKIKCRLP